MQVQCLVKPKRRMDRITADTDGSLRISIKAMPVDGKANEYLIRYLSEVFVLPAKNIEILSGFTSSHKRINIVAEDAYIQNIISKLKA